MSSTGEIFSGRFQLAEQFKAHPLCTRSQTTSLAAAMYHDTQSVRVYHFPHEDPEPHFLTLNKHHFKIQRGLDIPDLSPMFTSGCTVQPYTVTLPSTTQFAVFNILPRGATLNDALRTRSAYEWQGDVVVIRMSDIGQRLVNMRSGDDTRALQALLQ